MSVFSIYHTYVLQDGDVECSIVPGLLHNTVASNCKPNDEDAQTGMVIIHSVCVCSVCVQMACVCMCLCSVYWLQVFMHSTGLFLQLYIRHKSITWKFWFIFEYLDVWPFACCVW